MKAISSRTVFIAFHISCFSVSGPRWRNERVSCSAGWIRICKTKF